MTDTAVSPAVAGGVAAVLHGLGLDPYVLAVATVGAVFLQAWSDKPTDRWLAIFRVVLSGFVGALLSQGVADMADLDSRAAEMALSAFCGFCAFDLFSALAKQGDSIIGNLASRWGGPKQ